MVRTYWIDFIFKHSRPDIREAQRDKNGEHHAPKRAMQMEAGAHFN